MRDALKRLLDRLDGISKDHGEVDDTVVREQAHDAIYHLFVRADPDATLPTSFGMFSAEGDAALREALAAFLVEPAVAEMTRSATSQERLVAFQDGSVISDQGLPFDDHFGEAGEVY